MKDAIESWELYLGFDQQDDEAHGHLQALYGELGAEQDVLRVIRRRFEIAEDLSHRLRLLKEEALVAELKLGDYEGAFDAWSKAHELSPEDIVILEELIRLATIRNDDQQLVRFGVIWLALPDRYNDKDLLYEIGRACLRTKDLVLHHWSGSR